MPSPTQLFALAAFACRAVAVPPAIRWHSDISTSNSTSKYELVSTYSGTTFFTHFTAFTGPDPTNGFVNYTDMAFAAEEGLIGLIQHGESNSTTTYIGVDHTNLAPNGRNAVRLMSKETFNAGSMAVIDLHHIPSQHGLWPAIWMLGSQGAWPASGESDILEYVHKNDFTAMTLHTAPGCSVSNATTFQGNLLNTDCNHGNAATGCSVDARGQNKLASKFPSNGTTMATAGAPFNTQGGGVYVHDWQEDGITVWLFPHSDLPADLISGRPNPDTWTQKSLAKFSGDCDFSAAFKDMQLIINIDFGGDWAGKVWESSGSANATGCTTVEDYVANHPEKFEDAYFDVASVKFYSNNGRKAGNSTTQTTKRELPLERLMVRTGTRGAANIRNKTLATKAVHVWQSKASDASESLQVSSWLAAAGMFLLIAFLA